MISTLILTKNEERDLPECLESVRWCDDVHVFDSHSTDRTIEIARQFGATVTRRTFDNWSNHQNWGLANIPFKYPWVLYIDADERVSDALRNSLQNGSWMETKFVAFEIQRRDFAWNGTWLRHAQISPFYLRLFRPGRIRYERLVNPVSIVDGPTGRLEGSIDHYPFSKGVLYWIQRHLGYADLEARMIEANRDQQESFRVNKALFSRDFTERRYHQKGLFYMFPGRPLIKFAYMVFWRRAFLDGWAGITYAILQSIYEYFIVLKQKELLNRLDA
jgi:glycosyltransferase involved in cell wall biosynthesis